MAAPSCERGEESSQSPKPVHAKPEPQHMNSCDRDTPKMNPLFPRTWRQATDDNRLTLFGLRRFRTAHLLNLRFSEAEIAQVDRQIYQAGLSLGITPGEIDRLGLKHARRNPDFTAESGIPDSLILKLRELLKQYSMNVQSLSSIQD